MENGNRKRIVAVDDSPIILKRLTELLGGKYDFVPFAKGMRALQYLREKPERPSLIILDVEMPDINGYQLLRQIRNLYQDINVPPVIFLTSSHEKEDVMKAVFYGAKDYAVKPIVEDVFMSKVQKTLGEST